jgi:phosphohistidine phosphatase
MKKLYIIRHAKSGLKNSGLDDFERPLSKRGKKDAPFMGSMLKNRGVLPDIIISSPALRAKSTAEIVANEIGYVKSIVYDKNIYEASVEELYNILADISDKKSSAMLFGHNPELNMLVEDLFGFNENIPTCGVVEIEFDCKKWSEISSENSKLISFDYPKKYK